MKATIAAAIVIVLTSSPTPAAVLHVPQDYPTIGQAAQAATPGDTVLVASGTYPGEEVYIPQPLTILSEAGPAATILQGSVLHIRPPDDHGTFPVVVNGLTFLGATRSAITLIDEFGARELSLTVDSCWFLGNGRLSHTGGAVDILLYARPTAALDIRHCRFEDNETLDWGGALAIQGMIRGSISDNAFIGNRAVKGAGLAMANINADVGGPPHYVVERNEFTNNVSSGEGGGLLIFSMSRYIDVRVNTFSGNTAGLHGGGIGVLNTSGDILLQQNLLVDNVAGDLGGGIAVVGSAVNASGNTLDGNAGTRGGGIAIYQPHVTDFLFRNISSRSPLGGGIFYAGPGGDLTTGCNDAWGNAAGEFIGFSQESTDFSLDPQYCDPGMGDYSLSSRSPCAPAHSPIGCGLIGAFPVGCETAGVSPDPATPQVGRHLVVSPNPFRTQVEIAFWVADAGWVELAINHPSGRRVGKLVATELDRGMHRVEWNGRDAKGRRCSGGVYIATLSTARGKSSVRLVALQ